MKTTTGADRVLAEIEALTKKSFLPIIGPVKVNIWRIPSYNTG